MLREIEINGRKVGDGHPVFLIAEVGLNHNADMQICKRLIDAAFATGWDCVKFQKRTPELCVPKAQWDKPKDTPWGKMTYIEYKKKIEFSKEQYDEIDAYCKTKPIMWTASVWDEPSLEFITKYDVPFIKIPSAKITQKSLLWGAGISGKPVIVSSGMSEMIEIDEALVSLWKTSPRNFAMLHTNSSYPARTDELNLKCIPLFLNRYTCPIGYSGHEYGLEPTVAAVVLGASIVERHITLDHTMWGTDQAASLEVHAMDMLRKRVEEVSKSLGNGVKTITPSELKIKEKQRG